MYFILISSPFVIAVFIIDRKFVVLKINLAISERYFLAFGSLLRRKSHINDSQLLLNNVLYNLARKSNRSV